MNHFFTFKNIIFNYRCDTINYIEFINEDIDYKKYCPKTIKHYSYLQFLSLKCYPPRHIPDILNT